MFKQIFILFLIAVVVKAQNKSLTAPAPNSLNTADYINLNRRQYANNINNYDLQLERFQSSYVDRVNTINTYLELLETSLLQNDERLNPLEVLSDLTRQCVLKYRPAIPTISSVKSTISSCVTSANNLVSSLLGTPRNTRNTLQNYYTNTFEREITNCNNKFGNLTLNYTICITSLTTTTNTYTINNQKTFATQIEASQCSANANIKRALDCHFSEQNRTISLIAEANASINRCILGLDDCDRCNQGYICQDAYFIRQSQVDYKNLTMLNPFYGRNESSDCLMLKLY